MPEIKLTAQKRTLVGKKVKKLRKEGLIPANIFGKKIKSQSLSLDKKEFEKVFEEVGETRIVNLEVGGEKEGRPVMIQNLQRNPVTEEILHADLRQVILTEKVTAGIPVEMTGEAPAAEQKLGILIQNISEIEVEALPLDLPEKFAVDVSGLANVGDEILVKSIKIDKSKVELKIDENQVVVKIEPLAKEEVAPPPAEEVVGEEAGEGAPAETEGEEKPEEKAGTTPPEV